MKTVMKKMFSLLLVAVMLIGVMPFAAFADTGVTITVTLNGEPQGTVVVPVPEGNAPLSDWMNSARGRLPENAQEFAKCDGFIGEQNEDITADMPFADSWVIYANFTSKYCTQCRTYDHNYEDGHCEHCGWGVGHSGTCTRNCTMGYDCTSDNHKDGCKYNKCKICGEDLHGDTPCCSQCHRTGHTVDAYCSKCNTCITHAESCIELCDESANCQAQTHKENCKSKLHCSKCGEQGHLVENCPKIVCSDCGYALATGDHKAGCITKCNNKRDCPNETVENGHHKPDCKYALCNTEDCELPQGHSGEHKGAVCGYNGQCTFWKGHTTKHSYECQTVGCNLPINHTGKCSNEYTHPNGTSKVKIYANLYTGDVLTKTVPLVVYNEDPNTSIADSIAEHKDLIYAELEDQYSGYEWSGNVYDSENEDGENMNSKVGKGINVHINAHSKENIVYLYVHNARTYDRIGIVRLHGKKVGEAVKESEVRKAVKEYFSFSSLKMYDTEKWDLYVDGKDVKSDDTLTVGSNHYVIDVKISGSAKNTSGAKADSSNPKTGDAIFAPAAVLGLSATTLAVLFYLNKKRAY